MPHAQSIASQVDCGKDQRSMNPRKDILLRAAYDLLMRSDQPGYIQEAQSILVRYDDADCDGRCLMSDIAIELDIDDGTKPIPLRHDE
jgi:hypothetical protein